MDLSKYKDKGRVGLENLGNTCFLNSCMQVLNNTYELNHFLDSDKYEKVLKKDVPDSQILSEWNDLRQHRQMVRQQRVKSLISQAI